MSQEKGSMIRGRGHNLEIEDITRIRKGEKTHKVEDIIEHTLKIGQDFPEIIGHSLEIEDIIRIRRGEKTRKVEDIIELTPEIDPDFPEIIGMIGHNLEIEEIQEITEEEACQGMEIREIIGANQETGAKRCLKNVSPAGVRNVSS